MLLSEEQNTDELYTPPDSPQNPASEGSFGYTEIEPVIPIAKYRQLLNDYETPDERISQRINYLSNFARKIIKTELTKYAEVQQGRAKK